MKLHGTTARGLWQRAVGWVRSHVLGATHETRAAAEVWNAQYESGRWTYLGQLSELSRYSVLVGYMVHFKPGGAILDVGCGEGVLLGRLKPHGYSRYVGVDISSRAIAEFAEQAGERQAFFVADGEHYIPTEPFDIIVFNEVLYLFRDPIGAVDRYAGSLRSGGLLLVSICTAYQGGPALIDRLKQAYVVLDETRVTHGSNPWAWVCLVLSPQ
jgi:SAM-dependent methyltransferase